MRAELHDFASKAWGVIPLAQQEGHFYTGWVSKTIADRMLVGRNAVVHGDFRITDWSRGRSAANMHGNFRGHPDVSYELGMEGLFSLWMLVQSQEFPVDDGYVTGRWTFTKQGTSMFLRPMAQGEL